ncbi:MAG: DUF547 domain-containing protein [Planctomycetes bacterium]|nr:DUF547 domain-containing protein [Planctomycetota bacterium]
MLPALYACYALLLAAPAAASTVEPAALVAPLFEFDHTHAAWKAVLDGRVTAGRFEYVALVKDRSQLDAYLALLTGVDQPEFAKWKKQEQLAFWINAYNAYTLRRVLESYPFEKVNELGAEKKGPWDERFIPLGKLAPELKQDKLTLNDIENKILRPKFKDARVHAAVNCAAESCPPLRPLPFTAEKLDEELDTQVTKWLQNSAFNRFDADKKEMQLSKLFEWYAKDFVDEAGSVQAWIAKHGPKHVVGWLDGAKDVKTSYFEYSWTLNAKKNE